MSITYFFPADDQSGNEENTVAFSSTEGSCTAYYLLVRLEQSRLG
ncbi:hypothetical protein [Rufibacter glacialis]|nr:hypothetical protein [Rufibacter glacialis]